jgi:hypothetical protein
MKPNQFRSLPRRCHKKLWKWCLTHDAAEDGTIGVSVLSSNRDGYYLLRHERRKRIGRATPLVTRREYGVSIEWSYVY